MNFLRHAVTALHALQLYGAAGIAAFGWAMGRLLGWDSRPWLGLWFSAALLIYNADRLQADPADPLNLPVRTVASRRFRPASFLLLGAAALFLVGWPLLRRDWLTLGLVLSGVFVALGYSFPLLGFRWKEVPLLKTFFAPTIVVASVFALPLLHGAPIADALTLGLTMAWSWGFLEFNMILCDLRDLEGDRVCGVISLPVRLGAAATRRLLFALLIGTAVLAALNAALVATPAWRAWGLLASLGTACLRALHVGSRTLQPERFYEWWVEGILFLPALACVLVFGPLR